MLKLVVIRYSFSCTKNGPITNSQFYDLGIGKRLMSLYKAIFGVSVNFTFNVQFHKQLLTNSQFLMCAVNLLIIEKANNCSGLNLTV